MNVLCIGLAVMDIAARPISQEDKWQEKQSISQVGIQMGGDAVTNEEARSAAFGDTADAKKEG